MADTLLCLAALCLLCLFFSSLRGVSSAAAPLLAASCVMLWFSFSGVFGVLVAGSWLFFGLCAVLGGYALIRRGGVGLLKRMLTPGFLLFLVFSLVLMCWLWAKNPTFTDWDEFSYWGSAAKRMTVSGEMYASMDSGHPWPAAERPGFVVLGYFASFFTKAFAPWKMYWAYGTMMTACVAALLAPFGWRRWRTAAPLAAFGLLVPFIMMLPYHTVHLYRPYLSAYGDVPAGMLFAGVLGLYFVLRQTHSPKLWLAALPLGAFVLVKDNLFPLALVAAGVMAMDSLLFGPGWAEKRPVLWQVTRRGADGPETRLLRVTPADNAPRWKRLLPRLAGFAGWWLVVLVVNSLWSIYPSSFTSGMVESNRSPMAAVAEALASMLGFAPPSARADAVLGQMVDLFLGRVAVDGGYQYGVVNLSALGSGLTTLLVIVGLYALAVVLAQNKRLRLRIALCGALMLGGFFAYQFELFAVYAFFNRAEGQGVFDYQRYLSSYFAAWLLSAVFWLALCARQPARRRVLARAGVLALALVMVFRVSVLARPGYTVLDVADSHFTPHRQRQARADAVAAKLPEDARVFFVCQGSDGGEWFEYAYLLLPHTLDYSITGGGSLVPAGSGDDVVTPNAMREYLDETGCDYILVARADEEFFTAYADLFFGDVQADNDEVSLYTRGEDGRYRLMEI